MPLAVGTLSSLMPSNVYHSSQEFVHFVVNIPVDTSPHSASPLRLAIELL